MPNVELQQKIDQLVVDVEETVTVEASAVTFITGAVAIIADLRLQLEALAATPEQLAVITDAGVRLDAAKDDLAAALAANP